ncbi:MAG: hypothetical protein ACSHWW_12605 [Nonlabens sp.]|uniref:hypothetical protein n=1 Tax=Nonlabens sp. TaxID=1888209 RepID=UPI003EF6E98E
MKKQILAIAVLSLTIFSCTSDDDGGSTTPNRAELYATSTANGDITVYDLVNGTSTLTTSSTSNEGIQYDAGSDELFVASRSDLYLSVYPNIEAQVNGTMTAITGVNSAANLISPRALAISGDKVVVADNDTNQFYVFTRTAAGLTLGDVVDTGFPVWGIEFVGDDLYAVVDSSSDLAIYENFLANSSISLLAPTKQITIEGIVRTHGIAYDATDNLLIMTDIGSAMSDSDGGYHLIPNATTQIAGVANGGTLSVATQTRVAGSNTLMGNPIDVTYDTVLNTVYIAEIANGGGRILGFSATASGNATPNESNMLAGASSVDFYNE